MKYDLLVTDQAMPQMLGTDLIIAARKIRPDLKVIIITGYRDSIPANTDSELGVSEIILKPLILSDFSKLIALFISPMRYSEPVQYVLSQ